MILRQLVENATVFDRNGRRHAPEDRHIYYYNHRRTPRFVVRIRRGKVLRYFGSYLSLRAARAARDCAARSL